MNKKDNRGAFIAFEGIDGSGKSTQSALLIQKLRQEGVPCYATMEPTDAPIGSLIRQVMTGRVKTDNKAVAALFAADRLDHLLNEVDGIVSKIESGITVVTDRYYFSSYAYNSVHMPMEWVIKANEQSSAILRPSVTVYIDIDPDTALDRIAKNRFRQELFEKKSMLVKVRDNYMKAFKLLEKEEKVVIVDGNRPQEEIAEAVWNAVKEYFSFES